MPLRLETELREQSLTDPSPRPLFLRGGWAQGRVDRDVTLEERAELRRGSVAIRADRLTRYDADDEVIAVGDVRIRHGAQIATGPRLQLSLDAMTGRMESPRVLMPASGAVGRGSLLEFIDRHRAVMRDAFYTSCRPDDPDWMLKAREITLDETANEGVARGATLYFKDVPVMALPWLGFGLTDERRSGFMAPMLAQSSRLGAEVRVPYYWNIAPNRDLLWSANLSARRSLQVSGTARTLDTFGMSTTIFEITPYDPVVQDSRWMLNSTGTANLAGWASGWTLRGVSDDNYFVDYARSIAQSADRSLPRTAFMARGWGDWTLRLGMLQHQNILEARNAPPYDRLPQITLNHARRDLSGLDLLTTVDLSQFQRRLAGTAEGWRMTVHPSASYQLGSPFWFVTPKVGARLSAYQLSANPAGATELNRAIPTLSVDSGLVFERSARLAGQAMTQTLEPRLFYVRTPYRDQSAIPVFDSSVINLNFASLFSENVYAGSDRVADANQLTLGAVSRFIQTDTGVERLRLAAGQRFYFSPQQVTLPGVSPRTDTRSDLLLAVAGGIAADQFLDAAVQFSLSEGAVPRAGISWRWWPNYDHLLNVALRYQSRDYAQLDTSWRWRVNGGWSSLGRLNYSLLKFDATAGNVQTVAPQLIEGLLGFEYQADCWSARFVAQRFLTASALRTTTVFLQFEFNGFARLGIDPLDILSRGIPGYRPAPARPIGASRFHGYE
ncbi:MAG: LPS-assembly protein LptD [Burkholderiaceae bacterium]